MIREHKHLGLMILLFGLLLLRPVVPDSLMDFIFLVALVACAWLVSADRPGIQRVLMILAVPVIVGMTAIAFLAPGLAGILTRPIGVYLSLSIVALLVFSGCIILWSLVKTTEITENEIFGSVNLYVIVGFIWAYIYALVEFYRPLSFNINAAEGQTVSKLIYFSFVTLTTMGYGDITPQSEAAQMLTIVEAIVGQCYVAVVVTYLLSVHISQKINADREEE